MSKNVLVFAFVAKCFFNSVLSVLYSTCYEYETYCLFSFGPNVIVNNVKEARKFCDDAKNGSWPLEIVDERSLENVNKFILKHSFPEDTKLILNADKVGNKWRWIKTKSELHNKTNHPMNDNGDAKFYRLKMTEETISENNEFQIVCMTDCLSKLMKYDKKGYGEGIFRGGTTKKQCSEYCEQSECEAWEWVDYEDASNGCRVHKTIEGNMTESIGTLFEIDRSVKTIDNCIGILVEPPHSKTNSNTILISVLVVSLVVLGIISLILVKKKWRKMRPKQKDKVIAQANVSPNEGNEQQCKCTTKSNSYLSLISSPPPSSPIYAKQTRITDSQSETYEQIKF